MAVQLTEEQESAATKIREFLTAKTVDRQWLTMHGYAGVGKTSVLGHIAREFPWAWVATLTGRAADVLRKKTGANAYTLHSVFYKLKDKGLFQSGKERLKWDTVHRDGDLTGCALLLDECSMIDTTMAADILRTGVRVIACGDPGQLPPVNGEQFFKHPDITLKTVHRHALDSPILRQAHWIRLGRDYRSDGDGFQVVSQVSKEQLLEADVIMCWKNATRKAINHRVRFLKGIEKPNPQVGEKVLCLKNAGDFGLYNGATYILTREFKEGDTTIYVEVDGIEEKVPYVRFEDMPDGLSKFDEMTTHFAFAEGMTVHKMQGNEEEIGILIDEYSRSDYRREWLYTATTRISKKITVIRR
jgi:exodeoxyribonuclease-5